MKSLEEKLNNLGVEPFVFMITLEDYLNSDDFSGVNEEDVVNIEGIKVNKFDPIKSKDNTFYELLHKLDGISYGDKSLAAPKWVFADFMYHTYLVGVATTLSDAKNIGQEKVHKLLKEVPCGYDGLVPLSFYSAVIAPNEIFGNSMASIYGGKGLGLLTKKIGIEPWKAHKKISGFIQADNSSVISHSKISPLEIVAPNFTFLHGTPLSMKYTHAFEEVVGEDIWLSFDEDIREFLNQKQIEREQNKNKLYIVSPAIKEDKVLFRVKYL